MSLHLGVGRMGTIRRRLGLSYHLLQSLTFLGYSASGVVDYPNSRREDAVDIKVR